MNNTKIVQILGNNYPKEHIKYAYIGNQTRHKKFIKYPIVLFFLNLISFVYLATVEIYKHAHLFVGEKNIDIQIQLMTTHMNTMANIRNIFWFLFISSIISLVIVLIPRINCLFLKIEGIKKDMILYKSIHTDEVALLANEINLKIKEDNFSTFP